MNQSESKRKETSQSESRTKEMSQSESDNTMHLYFGCRNAYDHIYKDETNNMILKKVLTSVSTAYSRIPGKEKVGAIMKSISI